MRRKSHVLLPWTALARSAALVSVLAAQVAHAAACYTHWTTGVGHMAGSAYKIGLVGLARRIISDPRPELRVHRQDTPIHPSSSHETDPDSSVCIS